MKGWLRSLWAGVAALFEHHAFLTPQQADYLALKADWEAVGGDLWYAIRELQADRGAHSLEAKHLAHNQEDDGSTPSGPTT